MSYCPNCGKEVSPDAKFCPSCGHNLSAVSTSAPQVQPVRQEPTPEKELDDIRNDPFLRKFQLIEPSPDLPFKLQEGEVILMAIKPKKKVIAKFAFSTFIAAIILVIFLVIPFVSVLATSTSGPAGAKQTLLVLVGVFVGIVLLIIVVGVIYGYLAYNKYRYWITNHRTIGKRGVIGYSFDSMPLENVADVIVSRGILDRILGLATIYIQPIGGSGLMVPVRGIGMNRYTGSNSFIGLDPSATPEIQQLIFHLRDIRKKQTGRIL